MSDFVTKRCDCCGAIKGEANKWWIATTDSDVFEVARAGFYLDLGDLPLLDLCGAGCVQKKLSEWMIRATKEIT